jgi:general secretion pathway protein H
MITPPPQPSEAATDADPGAGGRSAGFTLFEMLLVLGLLALTLATSSLALTGRGRGQAPLQPVAAQVTADLKAARLDAMQTSRTIEVSFDGGARTYFVHGTRSAKRFPANIGFAFSSASDGLRPDFAQRLLFFPDGSSTGGQLTLSVPGPGASTARLVVLSVDWLTGAVREASGNR